MWFKNSYLDKEDVHRKLKYFELAEIISLFLKYLMFQLDHKPTLPLSKTESFPVDG